MKKQSYWHVRFDNGGGGIGGFDSLEEARSFCRGEEVDGAFFPEKAGPLQIAEWRGDLRVLHPMEDSLHSERRGS